ncbi:MAG: MBL fold metallo-hydrolase [Coriobacteriales bacterium]
MQAVRILDYPEVYLLKVPNPRFLNRSTNIYIAKKGRECLLVDAGFAGVAPLALVESALASLGFAGAPLTVFLTHLHLDHAGLVPQLSLNHRLKIVVGRAEYMGMMRIRESTPAMCSEWAPLLQNGMPRDEVDALAGLGSHSLVLPETLPVQTVVEGDELCIAGCELKAVDLSGHVPGHMGLLEQRSGALFSGDHLLFDASPALQSSYAPLNELDLYLANLRKVCELAPSKLLHSHGAIRDDYAQRAEWLIDHQAERKLEALELIRREPGLTGVEVASHMRWNCDGKSWERVSLPLRVCIAETAIMGINQLLYDGLVSRECPGGDGVYCYYPR